MQIHLNKLKGTTALFRDFLHREGSLKTFLGPDFRKAVSYEESASLVDQSTYDRGTLAGALVEQNRGLNASETTIRNAEILADDASVCVAGGHQVCLLGGPLLIFYKAISVIKLASRLAAFLDRPVVPVFWMATDDHDFAEVDHVYLPDGEEKLQKVRYEPVGPIAGAPTYRITLDDSVSLFLDQVEEMLQDTDFKSLLLNEVREDCQSGMTLGDSFGRLLLRYFGKYGLVLLDPHDSRLRRLSVDIFEREIRDHSRTASLVQETNNRLAADGYHIQVSRPSGFLNVFYDSGKRARISTGEEGFVIDGVTDRMSKKDLLRLLDKAPEKFSPNVLLRLIVQSRILPVVANVGGPAEIAYSCQMGRLFDFFDVPRPVTHPRIIATVLESRWKKFVDTRSIDLDALETNDSRESALTDLLRARLPEGWEESIESDSASVLDEFDKLRSYIEPDEGIQKTFEKTRGRIDRELRLFRDKVFKMHRKSHDDLSHKFRSCAEAIFPEQSLQDRHYSFMYFVNKYGPEVIDTIYESTEIEVFEHQMIEL